MPGNQFNNSLFFCVHAIYTLTPVYVRRIKMKKVFAHPEHCVNCHLCKVYCVTAHSQSKDIIKAHKKENLRGTARIIVEEKNPLSFGLQCRHCKDPKCVAGCISGAMYKETETGHVLWDATRCVGCLTCIVACPNGAIQVGADGKPLKCDLCKGMDEPACVAGCPNGALSFIEEEDL
jgi:carbon-monoxide dehydrogenase iron sulfur subunit